MSILKAGYQLLIYHRMEPQYLCLHLKETNINPSSRADVRNHFWPTTAFAGIKTDSRVTELSESQSMQ
jgi:hypothetical protein